MPTHAYIHSLHYDSASMKMAWNKIESWKAICSFTVSLYVKLRIKSTAILVTAWFSLVTWNNTTAGENESIPSLTVLQLHSYNSIDCWSVKHYQTNSKASFKYCHYLFSCYCFLSFLPFHTFMFLWLQTHKSFSYSQIPQQILYSLFHQSAIGSSILKHLPSLLGESKTLYQIIFEWGSVRKINNGLICTCAIRTCYV